MFRIIIEMQAQIYELKKIKQVFPSMALKGSTSKLKHPNARNQTGFIGFCLFPDGVWSLSEFRCLDQAHLPGPFKSSNWIWISWNLNSNHLLWFLFFFLSCADASLEAL